MTTANAPSYATDLDHLVDEIGWATARCRRIGARLDMVREAEDHIGLADATTEADRANPSKRQRLARLVVAENNLRQQIDARVEATGAAGRLLPLPHLREQFDLDDADMAALLLATVPALGFDLYETLAQIGQFSFGLMSVSPEMVAVFADMDMAGRLRLRDQLGEQGKLVQAGLIEQTWDGDRLNDFWSSALYITPKAFDLITGRAFEAAVLA
jgi:uncharacterized Zn finger protein